MKRKTLTPFVMFAFFVITLLMTSCNKTEALPEQNEAPSLSAQLQELVQDVPQSALTMRGSSSFDAIGFPASPAQGELGTSFTFIFKGSPANGFEAFDLYVRFVAPDGSSPTPIAMRKMPREGDYAVFRLDRTLQQVGLYYYEYVYYYGGSYRQMLGTTQQTVRVTPRPISSIPLGDDLNSLYHGTLKKGQCVTWVAGKVNQMWGTRNFQDLLGTDGRNANVWKDRLGALGYTADLNPQVGDIAWWESTNTRNGEIYGHVAFVHQVLDNGNTVVISEYNYTKPLSYMTPERVLKRNATRISQRFPHAFIHVQQKK